MVFAWPHARRWGWLKWTDKTLGSRLCKPRDDSNARSFGGVLAAFGLGGIVVSILGLKTIRLTFWKNYFKFIKSLNYQGFEFSNSWNSAK